MTLTRTIHRRECRKRARAEAVARQARWDAMTPEQQARETSFLENMRRSFTVVGNSLFELMPTVYQDIQFVSGDQWPQSVVDARK